MRKLLGALLIVTTIVVMTPRRATAAPAMVQAKHTDMVAGGAGTIAATFDSNVTSGNLIVVWASWGGTGSVETPTSLTDSRSTSYTRLANTAKVDAGNNQQAVMYWGVTTSSGANTVTLTLPASRTFRTITIVEFSGMSASPIDQSNGQFQSSTPSPSSASVTTTANGELVVSATINTSAGTATITNESNTISNRGTTDGTASQYETQVSAGSISGDWTATSGNYVSSVATFTVPAIVVAPQAKMQIMSPLIINVPAVMN